MNWLLLVYKIPREPTASRVYVWRKLRQLGAVSMQDATWVLPATARTREHFHWLAAEITELMGDASIFQSQLMFPNDEDSLREQFDAPIRAAYEQILAALEQRQPDLAALSKKYQQTKDRDYFRNELGEIVRQKLLSLRGGKPVKQDH